MLLRHSEVVRNYKTLLKPAPYIPLAFGNDVQAVGGSNQIAKQSHAPLAGYVVNASSGPSNTSGPSIHLPGKIPKYTTSPLVHSGPQPVGYMQAHAAYPIVRHKRIQQAYSTYNGEVVVVEVRMVAMPPGRVQPQLIHVCPIKWLKLYID